MLDTSEFRSVKTWKGEIYQSCVKFDHVTTGGSASLDANLVSRCGDKCSTRAVLFCVTTGEQTIPTEPHPNRIFHPLTVHVCTLLHPLFNNSLSHLLLWCWRRARIFHFLLHQRLLLCLGCGVRAHQSLGALVEEGAKDGTEADHLQTCDRMPICHI